MRELITIIFVMLLGVCLESVIFPNFSVATATESEKFLQNMYYYVLIAISIQVSYFIEKNRSNHVRNNKQTN